MAPRNSPGKEITSMKKITYLKTFGLTKQQNVTYSLLFFEPNYCMHYFIFLSNTHELCSDCSFFLIIDLALVYLLFIFFHLIPIFFYSNMPSTYFASFWIASWETRLNFFLVLHCGNSWKFNFYRPWQATPEQAMPS